MTSLILRGFSAAAAALLIACASSGGVPDDAATTVLSFQQLDCSDCGDEMARELIKLDGVYKTAFDKRKAELTVIAGDTTQSVFGYRGADPSLLRGDEPAITLTRSLRCAPVVVDAIAAVTRRLPGPDAACALTAAADRTGSLTVRIAATPHAESAVIADALRRAHLVDGVPWSQMAVSVRSVPRLGAPLARALVSAGVPMESPVQSAPLADQAAVRALLTVLDATARGLDGDRALALLTGPIGRVDPVTLRQLRRALRRADGCAPPRDFGDLLVDALDSDNERVSAELGRPLRKVRAVLAAARHSAAVGQDPRHTLWQAWHRSGLQRRWLAASGPRCASR